MNPRMNIKKMIEEQRKKLEHMAEHTENLTELLEEARKMDSLIEAYENRNTTS